MKFRGFLPIAGFFLLFALSCSGSPGGSVAADLVEPAVDSHPGLTAGGMRQNSVNSPHLWGIWEVCIDLANESIEAVPLRGVAFTANVNGFVDGPPSNLFLTLGTIDVQPDYTDIPVDVGLRHPFPGLDSFTGFDVLGVFLGTGTDAYPGPDGFPVSGENDQKLLNSDGYTRWFNEPEFSGATLPMLGYIPGQLGSPGFVPSAELNPYKFFADDLGKDDDAFNFLVNNTEDRGCFRPGSVNYRHYDLRFPSSTGITFQYAVVAHWEPNINAPAPPDGLDDFPPSANADEALVIDIKDSSTAYYVDGSTYGGSVILDMSPWDWSAECSGVMEEYEIRCYSDAWSGAYAVDMTPTDQGDNWCEFHAAIPVETLASGDPLPVWIKVSYPNLDYTNDFGVSNDADGPLAGFFLHAVPIASEVPAWIEVLIPNGGEEWANGSDEEIAWDSGDVLGTVFIEYSKDNFVSDINVIATDETNDGSFMWMDIPDDPSNTVRVRVSSTDDPAIFDISDEDFSIIGNGWAQTWGGSVSTGAGDNGYGVATDNSGNIYVTGVFKGTVDFDPGSGTENHTSSGHDDVFLSKFDSSGVFQWARTWGGGWNSGETQADVGRGVAIDDSGNVYVTGWFRLTADFDPGAGTDNHSSNGNRDVFLSKFDPSGAFQWALTWGGNDNDYGHGVTIDGSGNIYATGEFHQTVDFDPGGGTDVHSGGGTYVSKFDASGTFQWAGTWGGGKGYTVAADDTGNIYVTGYFGGTVDFDPGAGVENRAAVGYFDVYLNCLDSSGAFQWVQAWGGVSLDDGRGVAVDGSGNVYVEGYFQGEVDFDPSGGVDIHASNGNADIFLSQFSSSGVFQWAHTWGGTGFEYGYGVAVDGSGIIYTTGGFMNTVDFDPGAGIENHSSNGYRDVFLSTFNSTGEFQWVRTWGGSSSDHGFDVAVDGSGYSYVAGSFRYSVDFAPSGPPCNEPSDFHYSSGHDDAFLSKHIPDGCW